jgi:hypothetical protein
MAEKELTIADLGDDLDLSDEDVLEAGGLNDEDLKKAEDDDKELDEKLEVKDEEEEEKDDKKDEGKKKEGGFDVGEFKVEKEEDDDVDEEYKQDVEATTHLRDVTKKYPKVFKDFPELKSGLFRSRQYTEIFPTIEEAREAFDRGQVLNEVEKDIFDNGSTKELLTRVRKGDEKSFKKIASSVLGEIRGISEDAYFTAIIPVLDELILTLHQSGETKSDDNIKNAALIVNMLIHGGKTLPSGVQLGSRKNNNEDEENEESKENRVEREKLDREKGDIAFSRLSSAQKDVIGKVLGVLEKNLDRMISREKFGGKYVRGKLVGDVMDEVNVVLGKDTTHVRNMDLLWKKAQRLDYDDDSKKRIVSTILLKIGKILPKIQNDLEAEALAEGKVETKKDEMDEVDDSDKGERKAPNAQGIDWSETSDLDFLEGKVRYHR